MRKLVLVWLVLLLAGCANVVSPTGGARDEKPPEFVAAKPENYNLQYKSGVIRIDFDEYIKIQNPQNILISPNLAVKPDISERYKSLFIDLKDQPLSENTTYTINFASSIVDLTEGNKQTNFRYVFSTGTYLDSLRVSGKVILAEKQTTEANILVGMYPEEQGDSCLYKFKPFYFARTDAEGNFSLENLKYGRFRLFAFKDEDNNLLYKSAEEIAFLDSILTTDTLGAKLRLSLFVDPEGDRKPKEIRSVMPGLVRIKYAFPIDTATRVELVSSSAAIRPIIRGDSLLIFHQEKEADSLRFYLQKPTGTDTIKVINRKPSEKGYGRLILQKAATNTPSIYEPIELIANHPLKSVDNTGFTWKMDSTAVVLPFTTQINDNILRIEPAFAPDSRYELIIDSGAVTDFFDVPSDTFRILLNSGNAELFGTLILNELDSLQKGDLIQLLDETGKLIRQEVVNGQQSLRFERLRAIGYKVRVVRDENNNRRFDTGSYVRGKQPEKLWYVPDLVRLRSNWEVEVSLAGVVK